MAAMMGNLSELRTTIGSLGSMMEIREMMEADEEPLEDVDANITEALNEGDAIRTAMIRRGKVTQEESSAVLSFMRMKREVKAKMAPESD